MELWSIGVVELGSNVERSCLPRPFGEIPLMRESDGVLEWWSIGVLEYWSIGVLEW